MPKKIDVQIGQKINNFTVIAELGKNNSGKRVILCECACGEKKESTLQELRAKHTVSCGCLRKKHGLSRSRIYRIWTGIKQRCRIKTCSTYHKYGAKGIDICNDWHDDFLKFKDWSYNNNYNDFLTIDRIDNTKGYNPKNCRWVDYTLQNTNLGMLKNNTSGYTGVSWCKKYNNWVCNISINNKTKRIGAFKNINDALIARNKFIDDNNLPHKKNIL